MGEEQQASTQYGDLKGTIQVDGWDGLTVLSAGAGCPKGYWPVAVKFYGEPTSRGGELSLDVMVLAVDESILDGKGPDAVRRYARANGRIPVFAFDRKFDLPRAMKLIKRLSIMMQDKATEDATLLLAGYDELYQDDR